MNTPTLMFILWVLGMAMGSIPAWLIAKASLPKNWFMHLSFARSSAPIITGYPIKPNQRAITISEGRQRLRYHLLDGYGSPYGVGKKAHRGTMYFGHALAGGPIALRGDKAQPTKEVDGVLMPWEWQVKAIYPSAAQMAAAQDDDREVKMVQASRKSSGTGIPLMWILIGAGVLLFMLFGR